MHGPTCIVWANLTPSSLQRERPALVITGHSLGGSYAAVAARLRAPAAAGPLPPVVARGSRWG
jgi:hypothetical protein